MKSQILMADAKNELERVHTQTLTLLQQFEKYKAQFKSLAAAQVELLDSESYSLNVDKLEASMNINYTMPRAEEKKESADFMDSADFSDGLPESRSSRVPQEKTQERERVLRPVRREEVTTRMQEALNEKNTRGNGKSAEGGSYWPDGRFPGRAVVKSTVFNTKTPSVPEPAEDTAPQENEDSDGFDFIDL